MNFVQYAIECPDEPDCTVIVGEQDGVEVWRSHAHSEVRPEARIGDGYVVEDRRGDATVELKAVAPTKAEQAMLAPMTVD